MNYSDEKREIKVGDKIVLNDLGKYYVKYNSFPEYSKFFNEVVYGIVTVVDILFHNEFVEVSWVNHKGIIIKREWYIRKDYIDLYQDVPRET